jgi:hypothetical protein
MRGVCLLLAALCLPGSADAACSGETVKDPSTAGRPALYNDSFSCMEDKLDRIMELLGEGEGGNHPGHEHQKPSASEPMRSVRFDGIIARLDKAALTESRGHFKIVTEITLVNENSYAVLALITTPANRVLRVSGEANPRHVRIDFPTCAKARRRDVNRGCELAAGEDWALLLPNIPQSFKIATLPYRQEQASGTIHLGFRLIYKEEGGRRRPSFRDIAFSRIPLEGWGSEAKTRE